MNTIAIILIGIAFILHILFDHSKENEMTKRNKDVPSR